MGLHKLYGQVAQADVVDLVTDLAAKASTTYVDTQVGTRLPSDPTIVTLTTISTGNINISSPTHLATHRISVTGAAATLAVPTGMTDGESFDVQMAASIAMTLTIHASILRTSGLSSTFAVAAGKRWFGKLAVIGTTAYLLAATIQV